jgi:hypothetical protein
MIYSPLLLARTCYGDIGAKTLHTLPMMGVGVNMLRAGRVIFWLAQFVAMIYAGLICLEEGQTRAGDALGNS